MERRISLGKVFLGSLLAIVVNLCYYFGVVSAFKLCFVFCLDFIYVVLISATLIALVASISLAVTSAVTEVTWGGTENGKRGYPQGFLLWESFIMSVIIAAAAFFVGNFTAVLAQWLNLGFPSAGLFLYENLFPVFWKPYLASYAISLLLALILFCDRKHCAYKRKRRKAKVPQKV